jgi:hypothetical protein
LCGTHHLVPRFLLERGRDGFVTCTILFHRNSMISRRWLTLFAVLSAASMWLPSSAHADDFFFSFSNNGSSGTVTGEIFGLTNNATSALTDVVVQSYPAALTGAPAPPFSVPTWIATTPGAKQFGANTFTVSNDAIVAGTYLAAVDTPTGTTYAFEINNYGVNELAVHLPTDFGCLRCGQNLWGLAGVTFTLAPDPAPGPIPGAGLLSYIAIGILGLGSVDWQRLRMRSVS